MMVSGLTSQTYDNPSLSFITQRRLLGIIGLLLPIILVLGNWLVFGESELISSMSGYYHTQMGDVLVGMLFAFGFFLFTYKGPTLNHNLVGIFAGFFALGIALFPARPLDTTEYDAVSTAHVIFSFLFYSMLILYCFLLFPNPDPGEEVERLERRKIVYYVCGGIMAVCIILIGISSPENVSLFDNSTFWLEVIANTAFGVSWIVKGNFLWKLRD